MMNFTEKISNIWSNRAKNWFWPSKKRTFALFWIFFRTISLHQTEHFFVPAKSFQFQPVECSFQALTLEILFKFIVKFGFFYFRLRSRCSENCHLNSLLLPFLWILYKIKQVGYGNIISQRHKVCYTCKTWKSSFLL